MHKSMQQLTQQPTQKPGRNRQTDGSPAAAFTAAFLPGCLSSTSRADALRNVFKDFGVRLQTGHSGRWPQGAWTADVQLQSLENVRFIANVKPLEDAFRALTTHAGVCGNLRYARVRRHYQLIADTRVDGVTHLPQTLSELRAGFSRMAGCKAQRRKCAGKPETPSEDLLREDDALRDSVAAVLRSGGMSDDTVELETGWENRVRFEGSVIPVDLAICRGQVRLATPMCVPLPDAGSSAARAVLDMALCCNGRLRGARLAIRDDGLWAETLLHAGIISVDWLQRAARSVAAARHAWAAVFQALAECDRAAEAYCAYYLDA